MSISEQPPPGVPRSGEAGTMARHAGLTGVATLASRILGLARDQVLAAYFGAGKDMDAFVVAFRIPNLVRDLFAEGAMSAAFVPTFTRELTLRGKRDAWRLGNNVLNALILTTGFIVVLGMIFAGPHVATIVLVMVLTPLMPRAGLPPIMAVAIAALVGGLGQIAIRVAGAASWLTYAFRLMYLPTGLFGVSIATAALPAISRQATVGDSAAIRQAVSRGLSMMLMLNVPATLGLMVLATPIVRLLFERGHFLASDTAAINVIASVVLVRAIGFRGLALGTSIAAIANSGLLLGLLHRRLGGLDGARLSATVVKVTLSSVVMATAAVAIQHALDRVAPGTRPVAEALKLGATIAGSLAVLALMAKILGVEAFDEAVEMVGSRVRKLLPK